LLAFRSKQPLITTVAEIIKVVGSAFDLVALLIAEDIIVHRRLDAEAGRVVIDVAQIERVLVNLCRQRARCEHGRGQLVGVDGER
jgi:hypothetical protein